MKSLLVLRHAKSSWKDATQDDHERPLNKRGSRAAPRMGRLIREERIVPDFVVSSTAVRARSTAELIAEHCRYDGETVLTRDLYHAFAGQIIGVLRAVDDMHDRVMIVGHNPGLEDLVTELTGRFEDLPTAALASIATGVQHWRDLAPGGANLVQLWRPKELDG